MVLLRKGKMYFGFLNYNGDLFQVQMSTPEMVRTGSQVNQLGLGFWPSLLTVNLLTYLKKGGFLVIFSRNTEVVINFSFTLIDLPQFHQIVRFWSHASVWLERLILVKNRVAQLRLIDHVTCNVTKSALRVKYERSTLHTAPKVHILP